MGGELLMKEGSNMDINDNEPQNNNNNNGDLAEMVINLP